MAEIDYGDKKNWYKDLAGAELDEDGKPIVGTSEAEKWFKKYIAPYLNIVKVEIQPDGNFIAYFNDGSAFGPAANSQTRTWKFYPKATKKCINSQVDISAGICFFYFNFNPSAVIENWHYLIDKGFEPYKWNWDGSLQSLYDGCAGKVDDGSIHGYCATLIQYNGWKIPKDYPHKVNY